MITSSTIPAKRKQNAIDASPDLSAYRLEFEQCPPTDTNNHNTPNINDTSDQSTEAVDCICGFPIDDGFSIACDICSRWCHGACFGIAQDGVPDDFECWVCKPRPPADKERAVRLQKERLGIGGSGNDRKHRRASATTIDTGGAGKRKRRPSLPTPNDDEHVDIDEPWMQSYVHITQDIIADDETRTKLRRHAQHWRGITAVTDVSSSTPPPITVKELPPHTTHNPFLTFNSNPQVLPPTYGVHTTAPIPSDRFITPYTSSIASSSSYLSNPLNAYAHLGMPKPFVHLFGPPLDLALDSRIVGNQGRFVRSGCRPNAVLRPVLCDKPAAEEETLGFGVFALRDLKAGEEIVLGWEWDDGNAVHNLPALLQTPHMFP
ncbi:hypothetical protein BDZ97DRAFT_1670954 [Flammula alnicola]|nr:hypothetical protein BDZ97DRAFT_1670954 [Flammula alnicola]